MNSRNEARDNQIRTLKGDKKMSWFENPALEEQHSSRVSRILPPQRRGHPTQVFPIAPPSDGRKAREVDSIPD